MKYLKGKHAVTQAIHANNKIDRIIIQIEKKNNKDIQNIIKACQKKGMKVQFLPTKIFLKNYPDPISQGIIAICKYKKQVELTYLFDNLNTNKLTWLCY